MTVIDKEGAEELGENIGSGIGGELSTPSSPEKKMIEAWSPSLDPNGSPLFSVTNPLVSQRRQILPQPDDTSTTTLSPSLVTALASALVAALSPHKKEFATLTTTSTTSEVNEAPPQFSMENPLRKQQTLSPALTLALTSAFTTALAPHKEEVTAAAATKSPGVKNDDSNFLIVNPLRQQEQQQQLEAAALSPALTAALTSALATVMAQSSSAVSPNPVAPMTALTPLAVSPQPLPQTMAVALAQQQQSVNRSPVVPSFHLWGGGGGSGDKSIHSSFSPPPPPLTIAQSVLPNTFSPSNNGDDKSLDHIMSFLMEKEVKSNKKTSLTQTAAAVMSSSSLSQRRGQGQEGGGGGGGGNFSVNPSPTSPRPLGKPPPLLFQSPKLRSSHITTLSSESVVNPLATAVEPLWQRKISRSTNVVYYVDVASGREAVVDLPKGAKLA